MDAIWCSDDGGMCNYVSCCNLDKRCQLYVEPRSGMVGGRWKKRGSWYDGVGGWQYWQGHLHRSGDNPDHFPWLLCLGRFPRGNLSIICVQFAHNASDGHTTGLQRRGCVWTTSDVSNISFEGCGTDLDRKEEAPLLPAQKVGVSEAR